MRIAFYFMNLRIHFTIKKLIISSKHIKNALFSFLSTFLIYMKKLSQFQIYKKMSVRR